MAKNPRKSPGVGRGENLAGDDAILKALAVEVLDQEAAAKVKEMRKRHRSGAEKNGISLGDLDMLYKRREDPVQTILGDIKRMIHYMGAIFKPVRTQYDMFVTASESIDTQHAAALAGRMAGITGKPPRPPPNLVGEDAQIWLDSHSTAAKARREAEGERKAEEKALADTLAAALKADANGEVIDGTGKGDNVVQIRAQATADFAKDNPDVVIPNVDAPPQGDGIFDGDGTVPPVVAGKAPAGERYMLATDDTLPSGRRSAYQDGKPVGSSIPGKLHVYEEHAEAAAFDEASPAELKAQSTRQAVTAAKQATDHIPTEEEIAAGARKLQETGFAPKPKSRRGLPGENLAK